MQLTTDKNETPFQSRTHSVVSDAALGPSGRELFRVLEQWLWLPVLPAEPQSRWHVTRELGGWKASRRCLCLEVILSGLCSPELQCSCFMTLWVATQFEIPVGELPTKSPRGLRVPRGPQVPPSGSGPSCHQPQAIRQHHFLLRFVSGQIQKGPFPTCGVSRGLAYSAAGAAGTGLGPLVWAGNR